MEESSVSVSEAVDVSDRSSSSEASSSQDSATGAAFVDLLEVVIDRLLIEVEIEGFAAFVDIFAACL